MGRGTNFFTKEQEKWIYQKWCDGYTQQQIADALFVNVRTVTRSLIGKHKRRTKLVAPAELINQFDKGEK